MKKLIVNADDFGITEAVSLGIVKAHKDGIVTSTTMMMNMPAIEHAAELSKQYPELGIGIHITLTAGKPLLNDVFTLVDQDGNFMGQYELQKKAKQISKEDIYREAKAQIEKFIEVMKKKPTHIDSHHFSMSHEFSFDVLKQLAQEYNLPYRAIKPQKCAEGFLDVYFTKEFYGENATEEFFTKDKGNLLKKDYVSEVMCHPGYVDYEILNKSSYNTERTKELYVLTRDSVKNWIKVHDIQLINYSHI